MKLQFNVESSPPHAPLSIEVDTFVIAGWAGRDLAAIDHHIEELAALGVPRPSAVPLFYRVANNQLTQADEIQVLGHDSSGEVEVLMFSHGGEQFISLTSDHTDRKLEAQSVALSKQVCAKPVGLSAWRFADVADRWDTLIIRAFIEEDGQLVIYQEGPLALLRTPDDLIRQYLGSETASWPEGLAMSCGTVGAIGGIRASRKFTMELFDPQTGRCLSHKYSIHNLPTIV